LKVVFGRPPFEDWARALIQAEQAMFSRSLHTITLHEIRHFIKSNEIDLFIPLTLADMRFSSLYDLGCERLSPQNFEIVRLLNEKNLFHDFMQYNGLADFLPDTYVVCTEEPRILQEIQYPAIFKPRVGAGGNGVQVLTEKSSYLEDRKNYIVQEYISGQQEYIGNYVFFRGNRVFSKVLTQTYDGEFTVKRGKMTDFETVDDFDHQRFSAIFSALNFTGAICIDFKMIGSDIKIFEINPRFGGTVACNYMTEVLRSLALLEN
jgi:predicted ATP-grasp superfamily ATP-dependent carboligase